LIYVISIHMPAILEARTRNIAAAKRLPRQAFVPIIDGRLQKNLLEGDTSHKIKFPTTIREAIAEADFHMTVMEFAGMDRDADPTSVSRGNSAHPISRREAILHILIPADITGQKIDGDDPVVARRRIGEAPATLNAPRLLKQFLVEANLANSVFGVEGTDNHRVDVLGIEIKYEKRIAEGENPDRVAFETLIDLIDASWTAKDVRNNHKATQKRKHDAWMTRKTITAAAAEHQKTLEADRPKGFDGRVIKDSPAAQVIYKIPVYTHTDDPI